MKTVHEVSKLSGISVRALHHYHAIGLLLPTKINEAGYRLYDDEALFKLQTIMMFREVGFSLNDIKKLMNNPQFDLQNALSDHIQLLKMQRDRLDKLILQAENMKKGTGADFSAFDKEKMKKYTEEAKQKWGKTDAYAESQEKMKNQTDAEQKANSDALMAQFASLGKLKDLSPSSPEAQNGIKALQDCITKNYYNCTKEILKALGTMYINDDRFRASIDSAGGEGTASFVNKAIEEYCK